MFFVPDRRKYYHYNYGYRCEKIKASSITPITCFTRIWKKFNDNKTINVTTINTFIIYWLLFFALISISQKNANPLRQTSSTFGKNSFQCIVKYWSSFVCDREYLSKLVWFGSGCSSLMNIIVTIRGEKMRKYFSNLNLGVIQIKSFIVKSFSLIDVLVRLS